MGKKDNADEEARRRAEEDREFARRKAEEDRLAREEKLAREAEERAWRYGKGSRD